MKKDAVVILYVAVQWLLTLLWVPFRLVSRLSLYLFRGSGYLGNVLVRPLYYGVVQAKRRYRGDPVWQEHDFMIGIGPPCEHCGVQVPPGRHEEGCRFVLGAIDELVSTLKEGLLHRAIRNKGTELAARMNRTRNSRPCPRCGAAVGEWCKSDDSRCVIHREREEIV